MPQPMLALQRNSFGRWRVILLLVALSLVAEQGRAEEPFHIQAHRGAGIAMPENTLESFEWSWERNVTPECDMRTTKDGEIVCFHDANLKRVVSDLDASQAAREIENLTLAEVQQLEVGKFRGQQFAGQRVPTIVSVFEAMRGRPERLLYLDFKNVDVDQLAKLVEKYDVARQIIFTTKDYDLIRQWKQQFPDSLTLNWNGGSEQELTQKLAALRKHDFAGITHLQIHVRVQEGNLTEPFMPSPKFLKEVGKELKSRGIVFQVLPWECSDQKVYEQLLALGVDSFATDYPEVTLAAVKKFRTEHPPEKVKKSVAPAASGSAGGF